MLITTKYLGPTNTRGARIKATAVGRNRSVTVSYPHTLVLGAAHMAAARALVIKLNSEPDAFRILDPLTCVGWGDRGAYFAVIPGAILPTQVASIVAKLDLHEECLKGNIEHMVEMGQDAQRAQGQLAFLDRARELITPAIDHYSA